MQRLRRAEDLFKNGCEVAFASRHLVIKVLLETRENIPYFFRSAQVGNSVGDGVVVLELSRGAASRDPVYGMHLGGQTP